MTDSFASLRLSRRSLLAGAVLAPTGIGAFFYGAEAIGATEGAFEAMHAWHTASLDNDGFLAQTASTFANVRLGCSFAPEQWSDQEQTDGAPLRGLAFCVEDLGLHEVRLPLRWDRVARRNGDVDLAPYRSYLDYCFQKGLNVCLNLGPMRTFRWPEDRAPEFALASLPRRPGQGEQIDWGSPLAEAAIDYLDRLLDRLLLEYGDEMRSLSAVQPENESFQGFDQHSWSVSSNYMKNLILRLDQRLPNVPILVTSAGRPALGEITALYKDLLRGDPRFKGRLVSGFDYYYATPRHDKIPLHRYLDPIALAFAFPAAKSCADNIADSRSVGFRIEVSEGQAEPYADVTAPGNSVRDFRFMLLRCADKALDRQQPSVLRIWGVEELAKKAMANQTTDQHQQIFDLIRRLARS